MTNDSTRYGGWFDEFCDENDVKHLRESFYHYLSGKGLITDPGHDELQEEWRAFLLNEVLGSFA